MNSENKGQSNAVMELIGCWPLTGNSSSSPSIPDSKSSLGVRVQGMDKNDGVGVGIAYGVTFNDKAVVIWRHLVFTQAVVVRLLQEVLVADFCHSLVGTVSGEELRPLFTHASFLDLLLQRQRLSSETPPVVLAAGGSSHDDHEETEGHQEDDEEDEAGLEETNAPRRRVGGDHGGNGCMRLPS